MPVKETESGKRFYKKFVGEALTIQEAGRLLSLSVPPSCIESISAVIRFDEEDYLADFKREAQESIYAPYHEQRIILRKAESLEDGGQADLILLDLILPKVDGFEVLKTLKADEKTKHIPVIVLTNLEGMEDIEKVISLGAATYLVKANYSLKEVLEKIQQTIK